jgi:hypothetical protein
MSKRVIAAIFLFALAALAQKPSPRGSGSGSGSGPSNQSGSFTAATSVTITHNLNTLNVIWQCYTAAGADIPVTSISGQTVNAITLNFASSTGKCVVNGTGGVGATGPAGATGATGSPGSNGTNGTNGAISTIADEGSALTVRPTINFTGTGVACSDDAGNTRTNCTINTGSASIASTTQVLKGDNAGAAVAATAGTDFSAPGTTETTSGGRTFTGAIDASGASSTKPMKSGIVAPATCALGETFFDTDATAGSNVMLCTAVNTWTAISGGGTPGGTSGQIQINSSSAFAGRNFPGMTDNGTSLVPDGTVFAELGGNNTYTGHGYFPASATQSITAATNTVACDRLTVAVSPTSSLTLTSAPTIAAGTDGQKCTIVNVGTFNLILQDQDTLGSSNLQLASSTVTIPPKGQLTLQYNSTVGDWIQDGISGGTADPNTVTAAGTLTSNFPMIGGGSKAAAVGTRSGNTTEFATSTGTKTSGTRALWDANGNLATSTFERRMLAPATGSAGTGELTGGLVTALAYGAGMTRTQLSTPLTALGRGAWRFAATATGTAVGNAYIILSTPGMSMVDGNTANISNMDVNLLISKSGAWVGTSKWRIEAVCPTLNGSTIGSAITYTTPSFTNVGSAGATTNVRTLVTINNVLSGLTCGPSNDIYLKIYRGVFDDGDAETGNLDITYGWLEITR